MSTDSKIYGRMTTEPLNATVPPAGDTATVIAGARAAGLTYLQHIVALHIPVTGDHLAPPPGPPDPAGPAAVCARVHTDLLVFVKGAA